MQLTHRIVLTGVSLGTAGLAAPAMADTIDLTVTLPRQPSEQAGSARPAVLRPEHVHRDFG